MLVNSNNLHFRGFLPQLVLMPDSAHSRRYCLFFVVTQLWYQYFRCSPYSIFWIEGYLPTFLMCQDSFGAGCM